MRCLRTLRTQCVQRVARVCMRQARLLLYKEGCRHYTAFISGATLQGGRKERINIFLIVLVNCS